MSDVVNKICKAEALREILHIVWNMLNELLENDIAQLNIKEDNIMVNITSLEVKLIDLAGVETAYSYSCYVAEYPYNKQLVIKRFMQMCERLNVNI